MIWQNNRGVSVIGKLGKFLDFILNFLPLFLMALLFVKVPKDIILAVSLCVILWKVLRNTKLILPSVVVGIFAISLNYIYPVPYWERILPFALSIVFLLWVLDCRSKDKPWLQQIIQTFRKNLEDFQKDRINIMQFIWEIFLVINVFVLAAFMYLGTFSYWVYYSSIGFYIILFSLIAFTILFVEDFRYLVNQSRDFLLRVLYLINHSINFSIFGTMCLTFLPILLFLRVTLFWNMDLFSKAVRVISHYSFIFVRWYTCFSRLIRMELIDLSGGKKSKLLVSNHICMFDVVLLFSYIPHIMSFISEKYLKNKLISPIALSCGYIPISQVNLFARKFAFDKAYDILKEGSPFVIYPEGTRSRTGELGKLNSGVFHMAIQNRVNITPVIYTMNEPFLNKTKLFQGQKCLVHLHAYILPEIDVSGMEYSKEAVEKLMVDFKQIYIDFMKSDKALAYTKITE